MRDASLSKYNSRSSGKQGGLHLEYESISILLNVQPKKILLVAQKRSGL